MLDVVFNVVGNLGVFCILLAYFLIQTDRLSSEDMWYPVINLAGAVLILISLYWQPNIPSIIMELCWIGISVYGMYSIWKKRRFEG